MQADRRLLGHSSVVSKPLLVSEQGSGEIAGGRHDWQPPIRVSELVFALLGFVLIGRHGHEGGGSLKLIAIQRFE